MKNTAEGFDSGIMPLGFEAVSGFSIQTINEFVNIISNNINDTSADNLRVL